MIFDENYTIPKMIKNSAEQYSEIVAQMKRVKNGEFEPVLYRELYQLGLDFGAALLSLGIKRGDPIGLISDNRAEWLYVDLGIMNIGAVDVPRGCDATPIDLEKILSLTEAKFVIVENNSQVIKLLSLKDKLPALKTVPQQNRSLARPWDCWGISARLCHHSKAEYISPNWCRHARMWNCGCRAAADCHCQRHIA